MKYAIVESGGKQYRAVEGDMIQVDLLDVEPGAQLKLEQVLLLANEGTVSVGTPKISGVSINTTVVDHIKGPKLVIFNYRPKKRYRVKTGHRQMYTLLKVESIEME
jgi:large subunit ribosomal protein L21